MDRKIQPNKEDHINTVIPSTRQACVQTHSVGKFLGDLKPDKSIYASSSKGSRVPRENLLQNFNSLERNADFRGFFPLIVRKKMS